MSKYPGRTARRKQRRSPLRIEVLEDRTVPTTITVTTVADTIAADGQVSLREAITPAANTNAIVQEAPAGQAAPIIDVIDFNIPGVGVHVIHLVAALPALIERVTIDGLTQPNAIVLDGSEAGAGVNGLSITTDGTTTIRGLTINSFGGAGISVAGPGNNVIDQNRIGLDITGAVARGNIGDGIIIAAGSSGNTIGSIAPTGGNFISGNGGNGIRVDGSNNNIVTNFIGISQTGTSAVGNQGSGILLVGNSNFVRGSLNDADQVQQVISGNGGPGVQIIGDFNILLGNRIGTNLAGTAALGNGGAGVLVAVTANSNTIGASNIGAQFSNLISGNKGAGIQVQGSNNILIGNIVGLNQAGTAAIGNALDGLILDGDFNTVQASFNLQSGTSFGTQVFSGNQGSGIRINGNSNFLLGNLIGTSLDGLSAIGNRGDGVTITSTATNNVVGLIVDGTGNLISGNAGNGVLVAGNFTSVQNNYIGTNAAGTGALGNGLNGVQLSSDSNAVVGVLVGSTIGRQIISANGGNGVRITGNNNFVSGSRIGTEISGAGALANALNGVFIALGANGNAIGNFAAAAGNLISGNIDNGVEVRGTNNYILNNTIGLDINGGTALGNGLDGILLRGNLNSVQSSSGLTNGPGIQVVSGNGGNGIRVTGRSNLISGTRIGTSAAGTAAVGNQLDGIVIDRQGFGNRIGSSAANFGNLVSANLGFGIEIFGRQNETLGNRIGLAIGGGNLFNLLGGISVTGIGNATFNNQFGQQF